MRKLLEHIAWYRAEQYLGKYKPYGVVVAGTFGRENTARAILHALRRVRHVRSGSRVEHTIDIPEGILGAQGHAEHSGIMRLLARSKMREISQFEPDTIITQLPLVMSPHTAPWALKKMFPRMLVLTQIGLEHIDLFINKDRVAHEYLTLANAMHGDSVVIVNADDDQVREISTNIHRPVISYGVHPKADVRVTRAVRAPGNKGLMIEVVLHDVHHELYLPHLFAKQHVSAVAAGLAVAHGMGASMEDAIRGLHTLKPQRGSLSQGVGGNGVHIIDDSYNTCPEQLESSLKSFATLPCEGKKIIVVGDMDNLASFAKVQHEEVGKLIVHIAPLVLFVGPLMHHAQDVAIAEGTKCDTHHFKTSNEAAAWLADHINKDDMVFVSGGKSMDMGKVVRSLKGK